MTMLYPAVINKKTPFIQWKPSFGSLRLSVSACQMINIMKPRCCLILLLAILGLSPASGHAQGNLVVNGSFEANGGSFNGWTVDNFTGDLFQGYPGVFVAPATNAPDGIYIAGFQIWGGEISQTFSTVPGADYALSFSAIELQGANSTYVSAGSLSAALNFTSSVSIQNGNGPNNTIWDSFNFIFQASSTNTTFSFYCVPQHIFLNDYFGADSLDDVSITAVPEPSSVALLGTSLIGGLVCLRRKRLK
jgi:Protein of unknown function (DUF642)/PEP-CTERM motif